mmetsp:Transcript_13118/g.20775  ORF Transcript_13118/g.20775 Transcript_13118/m.20775 type:complete len:522 (+) Transcript_13118:129-1694(+)|eukprot:CAMPEP_0179421012 /NCGR_PEP_ID=MMETSP0799-20121207/9510_1 /TAXON_ID=46947 /ORGANISM="Geminigera cryophila, Strain CCMP2564" /LENGTH=521 /DNA_ID=CAMNT_0021194733 /DNA_START=82 /DNA_END=1647 /DNA_ORIENTATION=+
MASGRAAGMQIEKVRLHPLTTNTPTGRGIPSSDGAGPSGSRSRVSSVSFRRTSTQSDGTPEIEAGEALLKVMHVLNLNPRVASSDRMQRSASGSPEDEDHPQDGTWGRERERAFQERSGAADEMHTGPSQTGEVIGDEIAFVGVNKAIENRVCINLRRMSWAESPRTMFLVEKTDGWRSLNCDGRRLEHLCVVALERICRYCKENLNLTVIVEGRIKRELPHLTFLKSCDDWDDEDFEDRDEKAALNSSPLSPKEIQQDNRAKMQRKLACVDFVVTLGNDGCVVAASSFFDGVVPPMLPFALDHAGSDKPQGLLCRTPHSEALEALDRLVKSPGGVHLGLRARLKCTFYNAAERCETCFYAMNDLVLDRGPSPFLTSVEVYCNNRKVTLVQGDGLIIATPTGSTAYSMAAGGSLVHPDVPCLLVTPLNPHSLSFRPLILPADITIKLQLTANARAPAWVAFDGRNRTCLNPGDRLLVQVAQYPVPVIIHGSSTSDWLDGHNAFMSRMVVDHIASFRLRPLL